MKELWYSNEDDLSGVMKKRILDYCNENRISLNHSLGGSGNGLEEIIKLKLLADLLQGGIAKWSDGLNIYLNYMSMENIYGKYW